MTTFFAFEDLTWPEVRRIPRRTPIVLPLGQNFPHAQLASVLGNPPEIGLLPAFPYGLNGSGLAVQSRTLGAYLQNLLDSLRDDGFSQVFLLTPQGMSFPDIPNRISIPQSSQDPLDRPTPAPFRPDSIPSDSDRDKVVLIPIGHTEQHAYHLPLSTDTLIIDAIARGVVDIAPQSATCLPVMPYGVSTHRQAFAGTFNAGGRAFEDFYLNVIDVLAGRGFTRFYLLSGHGGNCSFLTNVVKYAGERHPHIFCATTWLYLSGPQGIEALEKHRQSRIGGMGHAGELETSLILHLHPELVYMDRVQDETDFIATPSYYMDWVEGGALVANPPWTDDTRSGAYGAGSLGTATKGKFWLEAAIVEKAANVDEIHEQYRRRVGRRQQQHNGTN